MRDSEQTGGEVCDVREGVRGLCDVRRDGVIVFAELGGGEIRGFDGVRRRKVGRTGAVSSRLEGNRI